MKIKVKDYRIEDAALEEDRQNIQTEDGIIDIKTCDDCPKDEADTCRICFNNTNTQENPLLSACKCTGSMKFMHFLCLKSWLNLKLIFKQTTELNSYFWKTFECEICKTVYPCNYHL